MQFEIIFVTCYINQESIKLPVKENLTMQLTGTGFIFLTYKSGDMWLLMAVQWLKDIKLTFLWFIYPFFGLTGQLSQFQTSPLHSRQKVGGRIVSAQSPLLIFNQKSESISITFISGIKLNSLTTTRSLGHLWIQAKPGGNSSSIRY